MRRSSFLFNLLGAVGLVGLLSACGGGGGSSSPATGSASGSAASSGTVTGFGSVFVNGKRFDTSGSSFTVDGQSGSQGDLKLGMTVTVTGSFNGDQRSASTVQQKDAVEGLVQSIAADRLSLVVMGQTVLVDSTTLIDDSNGLNGNIGNLAAGDFVEVNGHIRPDGVIQATFIEKKLVGVTPEVRGFVSLHDATAKTFKIGNLTVDYSTSLIDNMPTPSGSNWNGLFVEIKGTNFNSVTTTLVATKVERENQGFGNNMDEFEVEGFVTQVVGVGDFFIGTTHVQTTPSTEFRGGTIDEIVVGAKLSAEGRLADGILTAKHVKFHAAVKLEGNIATINGNTFTIDGLPGITVTVNSQTEGGNNLSGGNHVRVRGRLGSSNSVIATRVEQRSQDDDVDLQGPVQSVSGQVLTILEVAVDTSTISNDNFEGLNDQIIGRAAFFNVVKEGTLVKVKGRLANGVVTWREAELED
ncbi:MAG: hypothetical protein HZB34_13745 [Nitrospirae bacterium]|nr:hypothetical protein [Nitrospirota bacterium]